jgi:RNA ligase
MEVLNDYKSRKLVKSRKHPDKDLFIWNYTDAVQMKGLWDDVTTRTRALVTDGSGRIVAHSFRKFHNIEHGLHFPSEKFTVFEKLDGSLCVLFWHDDEWIICSRGSFVSEQASEARKMIDTMYDLSHLDKGVAYSFEVIYPENRIVIDYKGRRELVFLAAFMEDGMEIKFSDQAIARCGFPVAKRYDGFADLTSLKDLNWRDAEGFVVRFSNGSRAKVKFPEYMALHRAVSNLNGLRVWEMFATGKTLEECAGMFPDEFHPWLKERWESIQSRYEESLATAQKDFDEIGQQPSRAAFAKLAARCKYPKLMFLLYKGDDVRRAAIDALRPSNGMTDLIYFDDVNS